MTTAIGTSAVCKNRSLSYSVHGSCDNVCASSLPPLPSQSSVPFLKQCKKLPVQPTAIAWGARSIVSAKLSAAAFHSRGVFFLKCPQYRFACNYGNFSSFHWHGRILLRNAVCTGDENAKGMDTWITVLTHNCPGLTSSCTLITWALWILPQNLSMPTCQAFYSTAYHVCLKIWRHLSVSQCMTWVYAGRTIELLLTCNGNPYEAFPFFLYIGSRKRRSILKLKVVTQDCIHAM